MSKPNTTPLEFEEQRTFVEWLEYMGLKFTAVPNSTYTKSINQKRRNTLSGLRPGFPDLIIIIPSNLSKSGKSELVFLEMKRKKGSVLSSFQKEWILALDEAGQDVIIAYGADDAIKLLSKFMV